MTAPLLRRLLPLLPLALGAHPVGTSLEFRPEAGQERTFTYDMKREFELESMEMTFRMGEMEQTMDEGPELSFTIRALGATGGLNISASHNFPDDNGQGGPTFHHARRILCGSSPTSGPSPYPTTGPSPSRR